MRPTIATLGAGGDPVDILKPTAPTMAREEQLQDWSGTQNLWPLARRPVSRHTRYDPWPGGL